MLVNNAGISGGRARPSQVDLGQLRRVFETNVFGIVIVTNAMLPLLRRSGAAVVVNVSSEVGSLAEASDPGSALAGMPPSGVYVPSKTAVNSLTVQYAKDLRADNILVNAINPGYCATDLNDHQGVLDAAQGASADYPDRHRPVDLCSRNSGPGSVTEVARGGALRWRVIAATRVIAVTRVSAPSRAGACRGCVRPRVA